MCQLVVVVEQKIEALLPETFAVVFDGRSRGDTHYVGVFPTYPDLSPLGFRKHLFAMSPMGGEDTLNGNEHYDFVE